METLLYQGRELLARRVNSQDGCLLVASYGRYEINHQGKEELLRDVQGTYYLRRTLQLCDVDGTNEHHASGRVHVHRLSLCAALQWAATRTNAETNHLRRDVAQALAPTTATTLLDLLDAQLGLRVLRYLYVSPWQLRAADVVQGCLEYALDHAFNDLERLHGGEVPMGEGFSDDGWGYVEERICEAANQRNVTQPTTASTAEEDDAPLRVVDLRGTPAADRPDMALAAAGAVESVDEEEDCPLRPVLLALATDWQSKAAEARTQAGHFNSLPAAGKFTAQADLLEGCAGALLAALNGKEGR